MKRKLFAILAAGTMMLSVGSSVSAEPNENAAAVVTHECVAGRGQGTVIVRGDMKSTQDVPATNSQGRGPCQPAPGQVR
jgi:hypothetical protein